VSPIETSVCKSLNNYILICNIHSRSLNDLALETCRYHQSTSTLMDCCYTSAITLESRSPHIITKKNYKIREGIPTIYEEVQTSVFYVFINKYPLRTIYTTSKKANQIFVLDTCNQFNLSQKFSFSLLRFVKRQCLNSNDPSIFQLSLSKHK
jgi:hypothetical protein